MARCQALFGCGVVCCVGCLLKLGVVGFTAGSLGIVFLVGVGTALQFRRETFFFHLIRDFCITSHIGFSGPS